MVWFMLKPLKSLFKTNGNNELHLRKLAILQVVPINFTIRNEQEKHSINSGFQKFLNSLDFPIQIVIGTNYINLDSYVNGLELRVEELAAKTKKPIFNQHFESYKEHLLNTIQSNSVLDRSFFIVIPEKSEIGLDVQIGVVEQQLKSLNLLFKRLNDEELLLVMSSFFNDILSESDRPKTSNNGMGKENYLHYMIAPRLIKQFPDKILVDNKECRVIYADGYPRLVEIGFLDKIITLNGIFDISIFIEPIPISEMMVTLNKELQKQRSDLYTCETKQ